MHWHLDQPLRNVQRSWIELTEKETELYNTLQQDGIVMMDYGLSEAEVRSISQSVLLSMISMRLLRLLLLLPSLLTALFAHCPLCSVYLLLLLRSAVTALAALIVLTVLCNWYTSAISITKQCQHTHY